MEVLETCSALNDSVGYLTASATVIFLRHLSVCLQGGQRGMRLVFLLSGKDHYLEFPSILLFFNMTFLMIIAVLALTGQQLMDIISNYAFDSCL